MVMYAGKKVEEGTVEEIFDNPKHPYTIGLLNSVPNVDDPEFELESIPGSLPSLNEQISGCRFHARCKFATDRCRSSEPQVSNVSASHQVSCWLMEEEVH
jgi:oligopeptide/dipeptide ABC transporter ATP-binding protein